MKPARHLVIFVKLPRQGQVKTRLAADIGGIAATRFYRQNLNTVVRRLARDKRYTTWIAVAPDTALRLPRFWPKQGRPTAIPQGSGDLGDRMGRVLRSSGKTVLPRGPAVIVGTDVPAIRPAHIVRAFRLLERNDGVFGPADDGGYWLVGLRRRPRTPEIFGNVRWSSEHALADTVANMGGLDIAYLETLADVDDGESYAASKTVSRGVL